MTTYRARELEEALKNKGFQLDRSTDDKIYYLWYQGKKTSVFTKISHGSGGEELGFRLLAKIQDQLHLDTAAQLRQFIQGDMSAASYIKHLRDKGVIQDPFRIREKVKLRHVPGPTGEIVSIDSKGSTVVVAWNDRSGALSRRTSTHPVNQLQRATPHR